MSSQFQIKYHVDAERLILIFMGNIAPETEFEAGNILSLMVDDITKNPDKCKYI